LELIFTGSTPCREIPSAEMPSIYAALPNRMYDPPAFPQLGDDTMSAAGPTLKQKAYKELKEFLAISAYLWLVFALFVLYKSVICSEPGTPLVAHGLALINALALGKIMLIAQSLHFADRFKNEPLIFPTLFKSAAFAIILGCFKVLEETLIGLYHGHSFEESLAGMGGGTLNGILCMIAILAVLLIPFFGFTELRGVLGEGKLASLFFASRHPAGSSS
jgi:hypothetical protein